VIFGLPGVVSGRYSAPHMHDSRSRDNNVTAFMFTQFLRPIGIARPLQMVGVDRHVRIREEDLKARASRAHRPTLG
jgi:hypothetical protein